MAEASKGRVEVTQADREAARAAYRCCFSHCKGENLCQVCSRIAAALAQARTEGAEDRAMLDFVIAHQGEFHISGRPESGYRVMDCRKGLSFYTDSHKTSREALRAAIDRMRKEENGG